MTTPPRAATDPATAGPSGRPGAGRPRRVTSPARLVALVAVAAGIGQGFGRFVFPVLLPAMKRDVLGSYSAAGFLGTANVAAYLAGALLVMVVSLRRPAHHILLGGLVLSTAAMFTLATAAGFAQLVAGMVMAGIGGAAIFIPGPGLVGAAVRPSQRGLAVGVIGAGIGLATLVGTQFARFSPGWWGDHAWRRVWALLGVISLLTLVAVLAGLRPAASVQAARPRLAALRAAPGWKPYVAGYFALGFGYVLTATYLVAAMRERGFGVAHAANVYGLFAVGFMVGGPVVGRLSDRVGRAPALVVAYGVAGLCPLLVLGYREPWLALASFCFGLLFSGSVSVVAVYVADVIPPGDTGPAFALVTVAYSVAQACGPQVGGLLVDATGSFTATFLLSSVTLLAAAATAVRLGRHAPSPARRSTSAAL